MKYLKSGVLIIIITTIFSCASKENRKKNYFIFLTKNHDFKNVSICIIPGTTAMTSQYFTKEIIKNLKQKSNLNVKNYSYVENKIYLDRNFIKEDTYKTNCISDEELANLEQSHKLLKCDYIYLVWDNYFRIVDNSSYKKYVIEIIGYLIKYPENKQIGYTQEIFTKKIYHTRSIDDDKEVEAILKNSALLISSELIMEWTLEK